MSIITPILWVFTVWLATSFAWNLRRKCRSGVGVMMQTVNISLLFCVQIIIVASLGLSPLHFLWMTPVAFVIGQLTLLFPFSLISPFGRVYASFCCLGLNDEEVRMNHERLGYAKELLSSGHSQQEAELMAQEKYPITRD